MIDEVFEYYKKLISKQKHIAINNTKNLEFKVIILKVFVDKLNEHKKKLCKSPLNQKERS